MSEEVLKALMQLFAIISKQDDGVSSHIRDYVEYFLNVQLSPDKVQEYLQLFDDFSVEKKEAPTAEGEAAPRVSKLTSVRDSVRTLSICKKINKTLSQKQKSVVLVRLWELLKAEGQFTPQRIAIINTAAEGFNISTEEYHDIENFCTKEDKESNNSENVLLIESHLKAATSEESHQKYKHILSDGLSGTLSILRIPSIELYFVKYNGHNEIYLNGLVFNTKSISLFAPGSTLRVPQGTVYYSDVVAHFLSDQNDVKISLNVKNLEYKFPNGNIGLRDINLSEGSGSLVAIMGASGAGKIGRAHV